MALALIDGDIIAYRAATAGQKTYAWGDGIKSVVEVEPEVAAKNAIDTVNEWAKKVACKDIMVGFTGATNFRTRVLPTYKANRKGTEKPAAFYAARAAVTSTFNTHLIEGLEADDLLGILATNPKYAGAVVVSLDKDLRTVPGRHFNPNKDHKVVTVREPDADAFWMMQTLMGDPVDGYTGIPGVGKVKAAKLLDGAWTMGTLWGRVLAAYQAAGLTTDHALIQARVARILRFSDYDKATKEVLLWHPTTPLRIAVGESSACAPTQVSATTDASTAPGCNP